MNSMKSHVVRTLLFVVLATLMASVRRLRRQHSSGIEEGRLQGGWQEARPRLEIAARSHAAERNERYAVPDTGARGAATFPPIQRERCRLPRRQPGTGPCCRRSTRCASSVRVASAGWWWAGTPDQIWPQVKEFWQETGFLIDIEQPEAGVMETDWAENRAKLAATTSSRCHRQGVSTASIRLPERDKFRTRLEPGAEPGTTLKSTSAIAACMRCTSTKAQRQPVWQPRPADPELEAEMLRRLMVRLGVDEARAKTLVAADQRQDRAKLSRATDGVGALLLEEAFDRAWRRVGLALDRVGFTVEDRDRAQGMYFVRYVDPDSDAKKKDAEKGFLSKLMFWKGGGSDAPDKVQYRIHLKASGEATSVQVLTREGGVDRSDTSRRILGLLHEQLK
jgi:outer membrane protein assembly factor BamC